MDRKTEIAEKTDRVVRMLVAENLGGVLLGTQHNFSWLTAGGTNSIDMSREAGACALLVRSDGKRFVLASRNEMPRLLEEELPAGDFEPVEFAWEEEKASATYFPDRALALLSHGAALGSDLPYSVKTRIVESAIARCRYQLIGTESERYRLLGQDAGVAIGDLMRSLKPGETEAEIARRATDALAAQGIRAVVLLVAADERLQKFRHPVPTSRSWERIVALSVCARRGGLIVSLSRIVCAGEVGPELRRRTAACARVFAQLLSATQPGATGADLYKLASRSYAAEGFAGEERLHHQGGSCGYRTRDWVAHPLSGEIVNLNQGFAWNPTITGTKIEETCITRADGVEIITSTPGWPQIPVLINEREYLAPDVLTL